MPHATYALTRPVEPMRKKRKRRATLNTYRATLNTYRATSAKRAQIAHILRTRCCETACEAIAPEYTW